MRRVFLVGTAVLAAAVATTADNGYDSNDGRNRGRNQSYAIGAWGDLPYSDLQATVGVPNLIADMNAQDLAFTVHNGDLKAGSGTPGRRHRRRAATNSTRRRLPISGR